MVKINSSVWNNFINALSEFWDLIRQYNTAFNEKFPTTVQIIQLTFIYYFAFVDLLYSILSNVFSLGYYPEILAPFYPFLISILKSPILRIWASPEKVFFLSYFVIEFMVVRPTLKFSKLVKYNILLVFALLMLQGLVISYWDLLFHRQIAAPVAKWTYDQGIFLSTDKTLAIFFFFFTFMVFIFLYIYLYLTAAAGKFILLPKMKWLTDSIAFWLKIKTPTMRLGDEENRRKKL